MPISSGPAPLSLYHLLDPDVLADPYPLYERLRTEAPVHWDPYLHAWVVTRYADVIQVFQTMSADRTPSPERLAALGMEQLGPIAQVMVRQMLFLDPPEHSRVRGLAAAAFTPRRVDRLRARIQEITDSLIDEVIGTGEMEVMEAMANPLPAVVTAEMFGMPSSDHRMLKDWSQDFAEMLGNFQHNPGRAGRVLASVEAMTRYFGDAVRRQATEPTEGLINALATAEVEGDRLTEEEVVANVIVTMVGGQETTTNLIGNGLLTLLRHPEQLQRLRADPSLMPSAVEELLRYESPSQHTARLARTDVELGGETIRQRDAVIAVMGAANRDPERFHDPDRLDLARADNRHLAFAWASHFCFGAPLARLEGQIVLSTLLHRLPDLRLKDEPISWRPNLGLRGVTALPVAFGA
ncbi:MAG: cytochrome P450 [Candidatus Dormibacteria bacterium]